MLQYALHLYQILKQMISTKLTKEQKAQLKRATIKTGDISKIHRETGVARSTIYLMLEFGNATQQTITKVFNYLNEKK